MMAADECLVLTPEKVDKIKIDIAGVRTAMSKLTPCTPEEILQHQNIKHCCRSINRCLDEGLII